MHCCTKHLANLRSESHSQRNALRTAKLNPRYPNMLSLIIIPHENFQQSDWSIGRVTILNVTRQCLTAVKFVVSRNWTFGIIE